MSGGAVIGPGVAASIPACGKAYLVNAAGVLDASGDSVTRLVNGNNPDATWLRWSVTFNFGKQICHREGTASRPGASPCTSDDLFAVGACGDGGSCRCMGEVSTRQIVSDVLPPNGGNRRAVGSADADVAVKMAAADQCRIN